MNVEWLITGVIPFVLMVSALLAIPVTWLLLRNYRKAVLRLMNTMEGEASATETVKKMAKPKDALTINWLEAVDMKKAMLNQSAWRLVVVHGVAGAVFALVMSCGVILESGNELTLSRIIFLMLIFIWPFIFVVFLIAGADPQTQKRWLLHYGAVYLVSAVVVTIISSGFELYNGLSIWLIYNLPATILLMMFFRRSVRAVGPLVLIFLFFCVFGISALIGFGGDSVLIAVHFIVSSTGYNVYTAFIGLNVLVLAIGAACAWWVLVRIKRSYLQKNTNELSLNIDALWLFFGAIYSLIAATQTWYWVFLFIVAFACYKTTVWLGLKWLKHHTNPINKRLLLLRVFSLGKLSEQLFDMVSQRWRFRGSIQMIAGPDLVTSTIEPHELLDYLSGRLARLFINNQQAIDRQMQQLDLMPDFDGRYRVNEFFCYGSIWVSVLKRLVSSTDVVLMDLRQFSKDNAGCVTELHALIDLMPLQRVVLLIDGHTDKSYLQQTLATAWEAMDETSPNQSQKTVLRIFTLEKTDNHQVNALLSHLLL